MNKRSLTPRDEGSDTSGGINDRTPENNERQASHPAGIGESFVHNNQATGINNLLSPGMLLPDCVSSAEYLTRPRPIRTRDLATRNPSWSPIVQRTGTRNKDVMENEGTGGLVLSLAPPKASEEPLLTLTLGRDGRSEKNANSVMTQSMIELREYGKVLSLRPPRTEDNSWKNAFRLLGNETSFPKVGRTGVNVLTNYADVNPNSGFKYMPFSFNYDEHGPLASTVPFNQSFGRAYGKGADNFVQARNQFANQGQGLKLLGPSINAEQGTQVPPALTNQPLGQAYGRGTGGLYPAMIQGQGLRFMPAPQGPFFDKGKGVMASINAGLFYRIMEDNEAASSSTGKKELINKGKLILISDDNAELCDETDTVLVTQTASSDSTGNQERVNPVSTQPIINKGKGLLIQKDARQTYRTETIPTGIKEEAHSESSSSKLPQEGVDITGMKRKRKHEGVRPKGRAPSTVFPTDVRSLLSTGVLDGIPVKYATWMRDKVLRGIIAQNKILCGCRDCNYTRPINPLEFERHAGGNTKHPNNHIHFPNGKTIYEIVQGLQKVPTENLFQAMETMAGLPLHQEKFEAWKALSRASGIEARRVVGAAPSNAQGLSMKTAKDRAEN